MQVAGVRVRGASSPRLPRPLAKLAMLSTRVLGNGSMRDVSARVASVGPPRQRPGPSSSEAIAAPRAATFMAPLIGMDSARRRRSIAEPSSPLIVLLRQLAYMSRFAELRLASSWSALGTTVLFFSAVDLVEFGVNGVLDELVGPGPLGAVCCIVLGFSMMLWARLSGYKLINPLQRSTAEDGRL